MVDRGTSELFLLALYLVSVFTLTRSKIYVRMKLFEAIDGSINQVDCKATGLIVS